MDNPVIMLFIVGFGSALIGMGLQAASSALSDRENSSGSDFLRIAAYILYALGFAIGAIGSAVALDAAQSEWFIKRI